MRVVLFCLLCLSIPAWAEPPSPYIDESKPVISRFATALKAELQQAMKAGGPLNAVSVCNTEAPKIAGNMDTEGWQVRRTSLRWRNPDNHPDDWEIAQMRLFSQQMAKGADPDTLWAVYEDERQIRVLKAIPTQPICVTCHGSELAPNLKSKLQTLYPDDQATGFAPGDLRGAFSLQRFKF